MGMGRECGVDPTLTPSKTRGGEGACQITVLMAIGFVVVEVIELLENLAAHDSTEDAERVGNWWREQS